MITSDWKETNGSCNALASSESLALVPVSFLVDCPLRADGEVFAVDGVPMGRSATTPAKSTFGSVHVDPPKVFFLTRWSGLAGFGTPLVILKADAGAEFGDW